MTTPDQFIARVDPAKRDEVATLHALIRKTLPTFAPAVYGAMLGYGAYHYRYASGREGDSYRVAVAPNKSGISVYVNAVDVGGWLAEQARDGLGRASVGKSCIRIKRLADLDLAAFTALLRRVRAATTPGEVAPSAEPVARKNAPTKAPTKKAPTKKAPTKKAPTKKAPAKKAPTKKAPARKAPARKAPARRSSPARRITPTAGR
jgi:hypothetical protein